MMFDACHSYSYLSYALCSSFSRISTKIMWSVVIELLVFSPCSWSKHHPFRLMLFRFSRFCNRTHYFLLCSSDLDSNSFLENSLSAKEKIISELNMELHNIETILSNEREEHVNEIKKLNAILNEKVIYFLLYLMFIISSRYQCSHFPSSVPALVFFWKIK